MKFSKLLLMAPIIVLATGCGGGGLFNGSFFNHGGGGGGGGTGFGNPAIYTANLSADSITVYSLSAGGNAAPIRSLSACICHLAKPSQMFVDSSGDLFVANQGLTGAPPNFEEFAPGANGNAAPTRLVNSGLVSPQALTVDSSGNVYVGDPGQHAIFVYAPGQSTPSRTIGGPSGPASLVQTPEALAIAPNGDLYVADYGAKAVLVFAPGANNPVAPTAEITGLTAGPSGVALDSAGNIFVTTHDTGAILEFSANSSGPATPIKNISGPTTGLDQTMGIGLDASDNMYVGHGTSSGAGYAVFIFSAAQNGDVAPTTTISGGNTQLNAPFYVTI